MLIANRGEIALRLIQTCKKMKIETVAVYSDADASLPFVHAADAAYRIGDSPVSQSYLNMDAIIALALEEGVDSIHPGYGLLSENHLFAKKVRNAGLQFIGPLTETIEKMGDKVAARKTMQQAGIPVVPGSDGDVDHLEEAQKIAKEIGYPVMLKASGGGGGVGMVRCVNEQALNQHFSSTKARAKAYFGTDGVFIEKCIENARHIEVQIFGDQYGNVVHLYERNCSVQRRNQKVLEEAVSPQLSSMTQDKLYRLAIEAAKSVAYENAGTIEFIVDEQENIYFLEMNTRLQVEHPITEAITGLDLVKWQLLVAAGEKLPLSQAKIVPNGHALECRIYAEDPHTFYPSPGVIKTLEWGEVPNCRIDSGYTTASEVTTFYDPMIAKCIIHEQNRSDCLHKMIHFLETTKVEGIKTNIPFLLEVLHDPCFAEGTYTTSLTAQIKKQS